MDKLTHGGPAFPSHGSMGEVVQEGMSLRDYFASKALPALIAASQGHKTITRDDVVGEAYAHADSMLAARMQSSKVKGER